MNIKYDIIYNYVISNKIKGSEANISSRKRGSIATAQCFIYQDRFLAVRINKGKYFLSLRH